MVANTKILYTCIGVTCLHIITLWRLHLFSLNHVDSFGSASNENKFGLDNAKMSSSDNASKLINAKDLRTSPVKSKIRSIPSQNGGDEGRTETKMRSSILPEYLPDALQLDPSLLTIEQKRSDNCCAHWGQIKRKKPNGVECRGICFTPQACRKEENGNGFYPFRDKEEKNSFRRLADNVEELYQWRNKTREKCVIHKAPHQQPPARWNTTSPFPFAGDLPPPGCSIITGGGGAGSFQNLFIIPSAKLAFCGIPKVGISNWLQFIRFVMGAHDYPSYPHGKPDLLMWSFDKFRPEVQHRIWNDPEWTFAAFLRNPAERVLSAYLDKLKVEKRNGVIAKKLGFNESFTFDVFLDYLGRENPAEIDCGDTSNFISQVMGMSWCTDPHWRPQVWNCGISQKIDRFDFIGSLDHAEQHTQALLELVGLWESHGKHFRHGRSKRTSKLRNCVQLFPLQDEFENTTASLRHVGFQQVKQDDNSDPNGERPKSLSKVLENKLSWDTIGHAKGASTKMEEFYTPELYRKVKDKLFKADFQVWNFLDNENGDWISGKDILPHLLLNAQQEKE